MSGGGFHPIEHGFISGWGDSSLDNLGSGFSKFAGASLNFSVTRTGSITTNNANQADYTFSSHALGANSAAASRETYVFIMYEDADDGTNPSVDGFTIGGVGTGAAQVAAHGATLSPEGRISTELWSMPSAGLGASADIAISLTETVQLCTIDVWEVVDGIVLDAAGASDASTSDPSESTVTINTQAGAIAICFGWYDGNAGTDGAPIGFTQLEEVQVESNVGDEPYAIAGSNTSPDTPTDTYGIDQATGDRSGIVACTLVAG